MAFLIIIAPFALLLVFTCINTIINKYKEGQKAIRKIYPLEREIYRLKNEKSDVTRKLTNVTVNYTYTLTSLKTTKEKLDESIKELNKLRKVYNAITDTNPFKQTASCIADLQTIYLKHDEYYLKHKSRPAYEAAKKISESRKTAKEAIAKEREATYKLETIISVFPELKSYIDDNEGITELCNYKFIENLSDNYDHVRDHLSKEEYAQLTSIERNQLALDRYVEKRNKSNWAIGRDYEMSCAHVLRKEGYYVEMHGILKKIEDLGRDLIAYREFKDDLFDWDSKFEILVIQCKYWSNKREIHENVIMQLYGTYIAYRIEQERQGYIKFINKITPVLMIPSFSVLSETAKRFVETLDVKLVIQDMVEFPRIKCNINGSNKIYHLPFDQQYDNTQIKNKGEFYAFSVKEAEEKGFRRAMRHFVI